MTRGSQVSPQPAIAHVGLIAVAASFAGVILLMSAPRAWALDAPQPAVAAAVAVKPAAATSTRQPAELPSSVRIVKRPLEASRLTPEAFGDWETERPQ